MGFWDYHWISSYQCILKRQRYPLFKSASGHPDQTETKYYRPRRRLSKVPTADLSRVPDCPRPLRSRFHQTSLPTTKPKLREVDLVRRPDELRGVFYRDRRGSLILSSPSRKIRGGNLECKTVESMYDKKSSLDRPGREWPRSPSR